MGAIPHSVVSEGRGGLGPPLPHIARDQTMPDSAETVVLVDHTVTFHLGEAEQFVVPRRGATRGFVRTDWITVHFLTNGRSQVSAGGLICRKDGTFSEHWGRHGISVDLPDNAPWIERAQRHIDGCPDA